MKIIKVQKHFLSGAEVTLDVPEFANFGQRLGELERLADEANPIDPAAVEASTAAMMAHVRESQKNARKTLKAMPAGPKKDMHRLMLGLLEQMVERASQPQDQEDEDAQEPGAEQEVPFQHDRQRLQVSIPSGMKWNKTTRALLEQFFADWPQLRPAVLQATFRYYKKIYSESRTLFPNHQGVEFILPEPGSAEAVADLFYITSIHLRLDGAIGLGCYCTWDEEHGYGLRLRNGKVTAVGQADEAFS
jgi:hypothetical protein